MRSIDLVEVVTPDNSVVRPTYNKANLLDSLEANLGGGVAVTPFITNIDYDAKGQRTLIEYGNKVRTSYDYDPLTFRLTRMQTRRGAEALQDLRYTYDPMGNITHIQDDAQQTLFFRNRRVEPSNEYIYDAIYRLIEATGREHLGQVGGTPIPHSPSDAPRVGLKSGNVADQFGPNDGHAMGTYRERYLYDGVGNFKDMQHRGSDPAHPGWTRTYAYSEASLLEHAKQSNCLSSTTVGNGNQVTETYDHDKHGNMTRMPHLPLLRWDFRDKLQATAKQVVGGGAPETTYYVYDRSGQRVRTVTERQAAVGETPTRVKERTYLGGFEVFRHYEADGHTVKLERESLHIMDDRQRIALVETYTHENGGSLSQLIRFQLSNHLGSASLELDEQAQIISYEEYAPYGSTTYQAGRSEIEVTRKRYRYTGLERDEASGLSYHSARYYFPWLGRWANADPAGLVDGCNLYRYSNNNPVAGLDTSGCETREPREDSVRDTSGGRAKATRDSLLAGETLVSEIVGGLERARNSVLGKLQLALIENDLKQFRSGSTPSSRSTGRILKSQINDRLGSGALGRVFAAAFKGAVYAAEGYRRRSEGQGLVQTVVGTAATGTAALKSSVAAFERSRGMGWGLFAVGVLDLTLNLAGAPEEVTDASGFGANSTTVGIATSGVSDAVDTGFLVRDMLVGNESIAQMARMTERQANSSTPASGYAFLGMVLFGGGFDSKGDLSRFADSSRNSGFFASVADSTSDRAVRVSRLLGGGVVGHVGAAGATVPGVGILVEGGVSAGDYLINRTDWKRTLSPWRW